MRRSIPVSLGILVTVGIGILLGEIVPDYALLAVLPAFPVLALQIQSALQLVVAVFIGAVVASGRFFGAALVLTVLGWAAVVYFAYDIARLAKDPDWGEFALWNLLGLLLYLAAATVGALLGGQFYTRRPGNQPAAAR